MDDNGNRFLKSYRDRMGERGDVREPEAEAPAPAASPEAEMPALRFEEKSGFVQPRQNGRARTPPPKRPGYLVPAIIGLAAVAGIVAAVLLLANGGVAVDDFTGWTAADTQLWANTNKVNLQVLEAYDDKVEAGRIISQEPAKGTTVKRGGFIKATVSLGHDLSVSLELPDLMSMTKDEVDAWAKANFMAKVRVTTEFSESVEAGRVISYEINDNTVVGNVVTRNTPIYILISNGSKDAAATLITVPDFREKTLADSYQFATENGLALKVVEQFDDYAPKGSIVSQSVKPNEKAKKGDEITLTVSKGSMVTVPDFSVYSKQKAQAMAAELGIPSAVTETYSSKAAGGFISQSIAAGDIYEDGEVLELKYSLGNKITIGSFVGQSEDSIQSWKLQMNAQGAAITVSATYTQNSAPKGTILYQSASNTLISYKYTVKVTVSKGLMVFMPNFLAPDGAGYDVAITRDEAMEICEALGIIPVFEAKAKTGKLAGEIWAQGVAAGTEVSQGSTVKLTYVPAAQVGVPDFDGKTVAFVTDPLNNYFRMLDISFEYADEHVPGYDDTIYMQSLPAYSAVTAGSRITLTVSPAP